MPESSFGIWLDVIVPESNVYKDDNGNLLNYEANLKDRKQGTDENNFILNILFYHDNMIIFSEQKSWNRMLRQYGGKITTVETARMSAGTIMASTIMEVVLLKASFCAHDQLWRQTITY